MPSPVPRFSLRRLMLLIAVFGVGLAIRPTGYPWLALLIPLAWIVAPLRNRTVISLSILLLIFCALAEIMFGEPVNLAIYLPIAIVFSRAIGLKRPIVQNRDRLAALISVNLVILALYVLPWTSRKPFLRDLYSIKPGMTASEVRQIMARYIEETPTSPTNLLMFRHNTTDARFNADIGRITIQDGKVVGVDFLPD